MGKSISTLFVIHLFDFIYHIFFPEAFFWRVKKIIVHNSVVPTDIDGAHTQVEFLNACIKRFGEKDVMNEIKK